MGTELRTTSLIMRNEDLLYSDIGEEVLLLNEDLGSCFTLNETAARLWYLLRKPMKLMSIADMLMEEYEIDRDTCLDEITSLVRRLIDKNIVIPIKS